MVGSRSAVAAAFAALLGLAGPAFAAHPLVTEDTGTQGAGNVEFENGLAWQHADGTRLFSYQPQLSYGLAPNADLILQPSWLSSRGADGTTRRGAGDTNLDAKWRFFGAAPWSLGTRAGLALATSGHGLGLPHGEVAVHALLVATYDEAPFTVHANLGLNRNPRGSGQREWLGHASSALMFAFDEQLILTAELGADANPDPARHAWTGSGLAGLIYTLRPGLDVDLGYQAQLGGNAPARTWLFGLTYRFAL